MSILIKNATIVTQNASREIIKGDILIQDASISALGKKIDEKTETVLDASGMIAMPGLVNAHTHIAMTLFRGYGEGLPLDRWLEEKIWPAEKKQTSKDLEIAAKLAFCEMIQSGTTSFADMCIHDTRPLFAAAKQAGMRGIIARGLMDFDAPSRVPEIIRQGEASLAYGTALVAPSVAAHAPYTCSEELLVKSKELARKRGLKYQIHVSETRKEVFETLQKRGKYPYEYLDSIGVMDPDSIFVHGGWLTKKEIALAGERKLSVASCPVSNLKLATGGIAQISELDAAGATVALGTDSVASNNSLNMFETMKFASLLQKHHYWDALAFPPQKALDSATINGARALGLETGSIEPGKAADIILLDPGPNMRPGHGIVSDIVYAAGPRNVSDVLINGRIVMRKRQLLTLDEKEILHVADGISANRPAKQKNI